MIICPKCRANNDTGKEFCSDCGEFIGWESEAPALKLAPAVAAVTTAPVLDLPDSASDDLVKATEAARAARAEAVRVQAEAQAAALRASEEAKLRAVAEVKDGRQQARTKAEETMTAARLTSGLSRAELDALIAEVSDQAAVTARQEEEAAELRAARRARRAREEAYAKAQSETAAAERKAREAEHRAAALVAHAPPTPDRETATGPLRVPAPGVADTAPMRPAAPSAGGVGAPPRPGPPVGAVLPGAPAYRPGPPPPSAPSMVNEGDGRCAACGTVNPSTRRFCRRCGHSFIVVPVTAPLSRWAAFRQRLTGRRDQPRGGRSGEAQGRPPAKRPSRPPLNPKSVVRIGLAAAVVVVAVLALGPLHKQASSDFTSLRKTIIPRPSYIQDEQSFLGKGSTAAPELTDRAVGGKTKEFSSAELNTDPPSGAPLFRVRLGKNGDLTKPVDLFKVGIIAGVLGEAPPRHPAPRELLLIALGKNGHEEKRKTITLQDSTNFQSMLFDAKHVTEVDFYVLSTYHPPGRKGDYTIDQVEFFALT